jgi:nitrogen-specific signal transduction histidine kinase
VIPFLPYKVSIYLGAYQVDVKVIRDNGFLKVSVIDKGAGIPEDVQGYLFKDTLTTKKDGNGLGLLSCKSIIDENHQGKQ